jgi:hypothetical protein
MAKMFYTLDETARKLGKSPEQVKEMAKSGQIQEFRDRDKLMFKVEQIDLLASGDDAAMDSEIGLEQSGASGSALGLVDSREDTGISVFDTAHGEKGKSGAGDTHVPEAVEDELSLESVGSGSGLLDLTRESDDTSLGAELIEEVYSGDEGKVEVPAHASGLFEAAGAESPGNAIGVGVASGPMLVEVYDGAGSGLGIGLMLGALAALICVGIMVAVGVTNTTPALATQMGGNVLMWGGIIGGATIVLGLIGMFVGKASE